MNASIQPLQLLRISVAGWMGRRQQEVIEYLVKENRKRPTPALPRRLTLDWRVGRAARIALRR